MSLENEETNGHGRIGTCKLGMIARKELLESYEVAETFAHFLPVHGYHVVVHPIANHLIALRSHGLRYLAFVVGEYEVETASMNVEMVSEIFSAHEVRIPIV